MPKRSNLFQDVVGIIQRHLVGDSAVEESCLLVDRVTGEAREVDVVIRSRVAAQDIIIAFEATSGSRAADTPWIEMMLAKHADLPTNKLVLVAEAGFTGPARRKAEHEGVVALEPVDLSVGDPVFTIVNRLKSLWPKFVSLTPQRARVWVRRSDDDVVWFKAPSDLWVFWEDGRRLGTLVECIQAYINRSWEKIISDIDLANIAEDRDEFFRVVIGSPWLVDAQGKPVDLFAQHEDAPGGPELHQIQQVEVWGKAIIEVRKVDLSHRRLGDVTYAYGESDLAGRHALFVVSESDAGGLLTIRTL